MKTRMRSWPGYALAYLMWIVTLFLGVWIFLIGRNLFLVILVQVSSNTYQSTVQARFGERIFSIVLGLIWLVMMIGSEEYYRTGVLKKRLHERWSAVVGTELLVIFLIDFSLLLLQGVSNGAWLRGIILFAELAAGLLLLWYARFSRMSRLRKSSLDLLNNPG